MLFIMQELRDEPGDFIGTIGNLDARCLKCLHLCFGGSAIAGNNGTGVSHTFTGGCRFPRYEGDHRLFHVVCYVLGGPLFVFTADLTDKDNSSRSSTKSVPTTGSPPMPIQVDCPYPCRVKLYTIS